MAIKIGPQVEGDDFFGRTEELGLAIEEVFAGNHLSVKAPRRVGKSSFVQKLRTILKEEHGWGGIFFDMEGATDEVDFAKQMIDALKGNREKFTGVVQKALEGLEISIGGLIKYKKEGAAGKKADDLLVDLGNIINKIEGHFFIGIDELPVFLLHLLKEEDGPKRVSRFLHLLRSIRNNQENHPKNKTVWVFCGSIGLDYFARKNKVAGGLNDMKPFEEIGAFSKTESVKFLQRLNQKEKFHLTDEHIEYIIRITGWTIPFFLAILFEETKLYCRNKEAVSESHIDIAYNRALAKYKINFETWHTRLTEQLEPAEEAVSIKLLDACAVNKEGVSFSILHQLGYTIIKDPDLLKEVLTNLIDLLIHDGYLVEERGKYYFRSPFIRDWWINRRNLNL